MIFSTEIAVTKNKKHFLRLIETLIDNGIPRIKWF